MTIDHATLVDEDVMEPSSTQIFSTTEVAKMTGATYRQCDYWARNGLIPGMDPDGPGSGRRRVWTTAQVERVEFLMLASRLNNRPLIETADMLEQLDNQMALRQAAKAIDTRVS